MTIYTEIGANKRKTVTLIFGFLIFMAGLGYLFSRVFAVPWLLPVAITIALVQAFSGYYFSDKVALAVSGARPLPRSADFLTIHRIIENIAITAGLPKPAVYLINDEAANAFATGRDPAHASIAVTSGLPTLLNKQELEGVIAHELSHVGNYDTRVMTLVVVLVGIVALASDIVLRMTFWGGRRRDDSNSQIDTILFIGTFILALLAPLFASLIQLAISRKREFLADASGALLTRDPLELASALAKIDAQNQPLKAANRATAHLYIADPFKNHTDRVVLRFANLLATHPPIGERIKALKDMAA